MSIRTIRAGNVLGGGDWSENRIIPDLVNSLNKNKSIYVRSPNAIRPWSYVLDIVYGYLVIGEDCIDKIESFESYNLSPVHKKSYTVKELTREFLNNFNASNLVVLNKPSTFKEKDILKLSSKKALKKLNIKNYLSFEETLKFTADWYKEVLRNENPLKVTEALIEDYLNITLEKDTLYA